MYVLSQRPQPGAASQNKTFKERKRRKEQKGKMDDIE